MLRSEWLSIGFITVLVVLFGVVVVIICRECNGCEAFDERPINDVPARCYRCFAPSNMGSR